MLGVSQETILISFILCSTISVGITRLAENAENRKLEQALKKLKED